MLLGKGTEFALEIENPHVYLRTLRGLLGLSRSEFGREYGISAETVKKIEDGTSRGDGSTWTKVASTAELEALELAYYVEGAASEMLEDVEDSLRFGEAGDIRLYYEVAPSGKLVICDSDYFDEETGEDSFIVVPLHKAKSLLEHQIKELGS